MLEHVNLTFDEIEAIRLADFEGLYQEAAAQQMNVSRQTFGRIIESAHKKIADALVHGKALSIDGGKIEIDDSDIEKRACNFRTHRCGRGQHGHRRGQQE